MYKRRFVFTDKVIWTGRNTEVGREALWRQTSLETLYWRTGKKWAGGRRVLGRATMTLTLFPPARRHLWVGCLTFERSDEGLAGNQPRFTSSFCFLAVWSATATSPPLLCRTGPVGLSVNFSAERLPSVFCNELPCVRTTARA